MGANTEKGKMLYESIAKVLDGLGITYKRFEDDLVIVFSHRGEDMNHEILLAVNEKQEAIQMMERLPIKISPEYAYEVAAAACIVNSQILIGKFTYKMEQNLTFEVAQVFDGSLIGEDALKRMILTLVITVENYDDKFMALNKGYLKHTDFIQG